MKISTTRLEDVLLITPRVFGDDRGFFMETWEEQKFSDAGMPARFVQDNHSRSCKGTLRGLHYQLEQPQGKLVRVVSGSVFDVAVDLRKSSPTFGQWAGFELSEKNKQMVWIPPGFAHGFYVTSEFADFLYKCSDFYAPEDEHSLLWNDPAVGVEWPLIEGVETLLSGKDLNGKLLSDSKVYS